MDWLKDLFTISYWEILGSRFWSLLLVFIISFIVILWHIARYIKKTSDTNDEEKRWKKLSLGFGLFWYLFIALFIWGKIIFLGTADKMNNPFKAVYGELKADGQVSKTVEVVKSKTLDIFDKASEEVVDAIEEKVGEHVLEAVVEIASEEVVEVKEAATKKMEKIFRDTSEEFTELKDATSARLQGMFRQKEAPFEAEYVEEDE